ncbi:MAG: hypothetical protein AUH85_01825 [Chloroflexi bacterium 13_1_40CM_4_68_4]|nr:MAG: hypothetical protein AUH85_01825 [Chloroflexi bacterium 13_1_40CM_4_68_4]
MDIQQLRSWIFELYEPVPEERTYAILTGHDGILIDLPPFDRRVALQILGVMTPRLVFFTHAHRTTDIELWREALPDARFAVHEADLSMVRGEVVPAKNGDLLWRAPETRVLHIGTRTPGESMVITKVPGGVLFAGDALVVSASGAVALPDARYGTDEDIRAGLEKLREYEFSSMLSAHGRPVWNAAKERYLQLLNELPRPHKRFGHLLDAPWDRAYLRVRTQMSHNPIVPQAETIEEAAGHGPSTLVPAWERRPAREVSWPQTPVATAASAASGDGKKWSLATEGPRTLPPRRVSAVQSVPWDLLESPVTFRRISAAELVDIPQVDWLHKSFDVSRDGGEVVFSWNKTGTYEVYRAPVASDAIYQLTAGDPRSRALQPRIAPDGGWIAFLRDRDADERFDIHLVDRAARDERRLTDHPATRGELTWSPDGRALASISDEDGALALQVIDLVTGARRAIARNLRALEDLEHAPSWSFDSRFIVYHSADADANVDLYVVPADGSTPPWRLETRSATGQSRQGRFSADGRALAFATDARGRWEIAVLPVRDGKADGATRFLREGHFDDTDPLWDADPRRLLYRRNADALVSVRRAFLVSNDDEPALDVPGVHFAVDVAPDASLVYHWSGAREPADVFAKASDAVMPHRITRSLPANIPPGLFVEPRHVRYSSADGVEIPALLYLPHREAVDGQDCPPAVVVAHGGPTSQHFSCFDEWIQWFANRGYVVLAPNVRGSTGYGRAFREANRGDIGGKDVDDIVAGATWLAKERVADESRIGMFGISYGGYLTLMALARAPQRFAAGCDIVGPTSLGPFLAATRADIALAVELYVRGLSEAERSERSPIDLVDQIKAPVLILHGKKDPRVPVAEAEGLVAKLRERGKAFSYHAYDSGHRLILREQRQDALERAIEFFDEHVRDRPAAALTK